MVQLPCSFGKDQLEASPQEPGLSLAWGGVQSKTKIKLGATAGLRLLPGGQADKILEAVKAYFAQQPFILDPEFGVTILDGEPSPPPGDPELQLPLHLFEVRVGSRDSRGNAKKHRAYLITPVIIFEFSKCMQPECVVWDM